MNITIITVPQKDQRYRTCGDWQFDPVQEELTIRVTKLGNWRYEVLVAVHELMEVLLCIDRGIDERAVDEFDLRYEANRAFRYVDEPGDEVNCPYRDEHCFATGVERLLAGAMKISWKEYEKAIEEHS